MLTFQDILARWVLPSLALQHRAVRAAAFLHLLVLLARRGDGWLKRLLKHCWLRKLGPHGFQRHGRYPGLPPDDALDAFEALEVEEQGAADTSRWGPFRRAPLFWRYEFDPSCLSFSAGAEAWGKPGRRPGEIDEVSSCVGMGAACVLAVRRAYLGKACTKACVFGRFLHVCNCLRV